jgi:hypothetical protein
MGRHIEAMNGHLKERIEQETGLELLPGTKVMADIGGAHFVHAQNASSSVVLVPQPSNSPHDPLVGSVTRISSKLALTTMDRTGPKTGKQLYSSIRAFSLFQASSALCQLPLWPLFTWRNGIGRCPILHYWYVINF